MRLYLWDELWNGHGGTHNSKPCVRCLFFQPFVYEFRGEQKVECFTCFTYTVVLDPGNSSTYQCPFSSLSRNIFKFNDHKCDQYLK